MERGDSSALEYENFVNPLSQHRQLVSDDDDSLASLAQPADHVRV